MKRVLIVMVFLLTMSQAVLGYGNECGKNSIAVYGALGQPEYWALSVTAPANYEPVHFPMELTFVFGFGFDFGWGLNEKIDMLIGFNQFLRAPTADTEGESGPDYLAVTPIYMSIRYKTPFQFYFGAGLNWSVIRLQDNGLQYGESGGFGVQGFGGIEMRGTSGAAESYGVYGELGYSYMTGSTHDMYEGTLTRINQYSTGIYIRVGVRKYF